ncbi:MAG: methyltransferase domain-containing protein [Chitinispirillia bacterium]|jgi:ubiquinone/menaquinone biosynthesis C-methylase UbiE
MLSIFDDFKNKNVLDVGAGTGFYSFYALNQNAHVTAVDASQFMLDFIKKKDSVKKMIDSITHIAKDLKCKRIELDSAFHRKEAHKFYKSIGYENRAFLFSRTLK